MDLLDLAVKIGVKDNATSEVNELSGNLKGKLATAAKVAGAALAGVVAKQVVQGFADMVTKTAEVGDHIDKMSQKIGMSAEAYQKWDYVMERSDMSIDSMKQGMKTLSAQVEKGSDAFSKLGMSQEEVKSLSKEELFAKVVDGLSKMEEGTERSTLATKLLGRAGADMAPLLNQGSDAIKEQMEMADQYGMVMSDDAVKAAADFSDSMTTMQSAIEGWRNRIFSDFLPGCKDIVDGIADIASGSDEGWQKIANGAGKVANKIGEIGEGALKKAGEIASGLIEEASKADWGAIVTDAFDQIGEWAEAQDWEGIVGSAIDNAFGAIEFVADKLGGIFESVLAYMGEHAPEIGAKVLSILIFAAGKIASAIPRFVAAIGTLISRMIGAIGGAAASLAQSFGNIIQQGANAVGNKVGEFVSAGKNIIDGLIRGLRNSAGAVVSYIKGVCSRAADAVKSFFGIKSPSRLMMKYGAYISEGLALGIESGGGRVGKAMMKVSNGAIKSMNAYGSLRGASVGGGVVVNLNYEAGDDANKIVMEIANGLNSMKMAGVI